MILDKDLTERDRRQIWAAQLRDMPDEMIEAWVIERGGVIVDRAWYRRAMQVLLSNPAFSALPPGYPPDEGALPFEP